MLFWQAVATVPNKGQKRCEISQIFIMNSITIPYTLVALAMVIEFPFKFVEVIYNKTLD